MKKQRIVIIDDDEPISLLMQAILESAGYGVCLAANAVEANQYIWSETKPALIILDVMMPMLSGDTAAGIYKATSSSKSIPIIFVSGIPAPELEALTASTGAAGYLCKPFSAAKVIQTVRSVLDSEAI